MKAAVTGASGFIGRKIMEKAKGQLTVVGLTRSLPEQDTAEGCIWRETDYSVESLKEVLQDVDAVIHLAAIRGTGGRITDYHENEVILENILLAMKECGVKHMIFASSIAVYSDIGAIPWTEEMALTPKTLYGVSKAACEHLCMYYGKRDHIDCTIFRIAQVLGLGEKRKGMMNVFIDRADRGEQLKVQGKSLAKRQYIYVDDLAEAFVKAALCGKGQGILNIGMEEGCTNLEIAECINRVFANPSGIEYDDSFEETIEPSCMTCGRLHESLQVYPRSMEEAMNDIREVIRG